MTDVLQVEKREQFGSAATRRLRRAGQVPAVLYGHGEATEHLALSATDVRMLLRHHSKTVQLDGAVKETALVSDMQWDPLGIDVLHLDLTRVNLKEMVEVTVPVRIHGDAPGTRAGGVLLENTHDVEVRCSAGAIPEELQVDVNELQVGEHKSAGDLVLPEGVELVTPADVVIVHVEAARVDEEVGEVAVATEPEVIAKAGEEAEGEGEEQG